MRRPDCEDGEEGSVVEDRQEGGRKGGRKGGRERSRITEGNVKVGV